VERIRILLAEVPRMLREIIESAIAGQSDMRIVGAIDTRDRVTAALDRTPADVVIVGLRGSETTATLDSVLYDRPRLKLLAIGAHGRSSFLYELRPYSVPLGDMSPGGLVDAIRASADYLRASGADIIDVGCTPGLPFPALGDVVAELRAADFRVSIDSFDPAEIRTAVAAGAELVLSVNGSNLDAARELAGGNTRVVVIPDFGEGLDTLERNVSALDRWGVPYLIDPVIEPIGFGFMASLERYAEVHRRYPEAAQMMGIGNITELTSADSTGVNALLVAICEEVGVRAVLTTEVIPWARGAVREIDVARRLMHHAVRHRTLPKGVDDRLLTVKDPRILEYSEAELRQLHAAVTDPNFRIFTDREVITVFNHEIFVRGTDIQEIFSRLGVDEAAHAFYLGRELMKARLAITLGKTYRQEGSLAWGYLTPPDDVRSEHVKLTQRKRRGRAEGQADRQAAEGE